mmetsp:Transcript_11774/g.19365  ORF Transcript_11774/g.19365 Transcript_11774/m.19365 type:complete len:607 (-) Transcript_11774:544-2364(-)
MDALDDLDDVSLLEHEFGEEDELDFTCAPKKSPTSVESKIISSSAQEYHNTLPSSTSSLLCANAEEDSILSIFNENSSPGPTRNSKHNSNGSIVKSKNKVAPRPRNNSSSTSERKLRPKQSIISSPPSTKARLAVRMPHGDSIDTRVGRSIDTREGRRRIPGPAGKLRSRKGVGAKKDRKTSSIKWNSGSSLEAENGGYDVDFEAPAWKAACICLNLDLPKKNSRPYKPSGDFFKFNTEFATNRGFDQRIPYLIVIIKQFVECSTGAFVIVKDPFGQMQASIHAKVFNEYPTLGTGCVIIVRQISVLNPSPGSYYLNVTLENIVHIFPAGRRAPRARPGNISKFFTEVKSGVLSSSCSMLEANSKNAPPSDAQAARFFPSKRRLESKSQRPMTRTKRSFPDRTTKSKFSSSASTSHVTSSSTSFVAPRSQFNKTSAEYKVERSYLRRTPASSSFSNQSCNNQPSSSSSSNYPCNGTTTSSKRRSISAASYNARSSSTLPSNKMGTTGAIATTSGASHHSKNSNRFGVLAKSHNNSDIPDDENSSSRNQNGREGRRTKGRTGTEDRYPKNDIQIRNQKKEPSLQSDLVAMADNLLDGIDENEFDFEL